MYAYIEKIERSAGFLSKISVESSFPEWEMLADQVRTVGSSVPMNSWNFKNFTIALMSSPKNCSTV